MREQSLKPEPGGNTGKLTPPDFLNFSEALDHWAENVPDKLFLNDVTSGKKCNYSEFNRCINQCVRLLRDHGTGSQDIISVCIRNSVEFLVIYFASIRLGSIVNPLPSSLSENEIVKNLAFVNSKIVFLEKEKQAGVAKKYKVFPVEFKGEESFIDRLKEYSDKPLDIQLENDKPACLYHTSGTTSNPKGILYSHTNMVSLIRSICQDFTHTHNTIHLGILPMGHTAITNYSFLPVAYAGGTLVFSENFLKIRPDFWEIVEEHGASYVETVPTILFLLLNTRYPEFSKERVADTALKYIGCGSAPLPVSVQENIKKRFGLPVANLYGLSETGPSHFDDPNSEGWSPGSIGKPISVNKCKILDDEQKEVADEEVGEIALKGKNVFIGYYQNQGAYKAAVRDGWFLTGDLGYKGNDGKFYYVDRKKDLIIKGGVNVYPGELDEILFQHPAVMEASTIGVPDNVMGEEIVSFVVLKKQETAEVDERELVDFCRNHVQYNKCPRRIIIIEAIPQTASGKMLRNQLRELYALEHAG